MSLLCWLGRWPKVTKSMYYLQKRVFVSETGFTLQSGCLGNSLCNPSLTLKLTAILWLHPSKVVGITAVCHSAQLDSV